MDFLTRRSLVGPILLLATLLLLLMRAERANTPRLARVPAYAPTPSPTALLSAPAVALPTLQPPAAATPALAEVLSLSADRLTPHIELVDQSGVYSDQLDLLASELQLALDYVSARVAITPSTRIRVSIAREQGVDCSFHGVTYSLVRVVRIYSCPGIPLQRVVNIAAHEFVHQLAQDRYGQQHLQADVLLSEGLATWGAGRYWLSNRDSLDVFAREYRAAGYTMPLATHYAALGTIDGMNALYYQWGSFVGFLLETYGREAFDRLYTSGQERKPGSADYVGVYQQDLAGLEQLWQQRLNQ